MTIRTFIAIEIPNDALTQVKEIIRNEIGDIPNIKWEPIDKLHLTLKFLGDTKKESLDSYLSAIEKVTANYNKLELSFSKFGVFRKENMPKILWIGINENKYLSNLVFDLENEFYEFSFERENRKFKPHLTLLRFRGHEDSEKILSLIQLNLPLIKFTAEKITLFESKLLPSGSVYRSLKNFYLKN